MEHRDFNLRIKSVGDSGSFSGLGASYGNTDLGGDVILPGAFARTIAGARQFPLLWQHNPDEPIGSVKVADSAQGLQVEGQLLLSDPTAAKAYAFLKAGIIKGLSIGYDTIQESFENGVRQLKELRLWECSIVTFPMNESALVSSVKALSDADKQRHLKAIAHHQKGIAMHVKALLGDDMDADDDDSPENDPTLQEGDEDDSENPTDEGMSMVLSELKALAEQAGELA